MNKQKWRRRLHRVGWWFSPPRCPLCQRVVAPFARCKECLPEQRKLQMPEGKCSLSVEGVENILCFWQYKDLIRHGILQMKFQKMPWQAENFVLLILSHKGAYTFIRQFDIIVPVPSRKRKLHGRGYDVPRLLAQAISMAVGIPVAPKGTLVKIKDTPRQVGLDGEQRRKNLQDAFSVKNATPLLEKRVLIVDDVVTTGTTAKEVAKALHKAGVDHVGLWVLAQAEP